MDVIFHSVREWCYVLLLQVWDEITILEETESGKQVSSVIKVPSQVFNTIILSTSASLVQADAPCMVLSASSMVIITPNERVICSDMSMPIYAGSRENH